MSKLLIYFETDAADIGTIIGSIGSNMSLVSNLRIETAVEPKRKNKPIKMDDTPVRVVDTPLARSRTQTCIYDYIKTHGPSTYKDLRATLVANGCKETSLHPALSTLEKQGLIFRKNNEAFLV